MKIEDRCLNCKKEKCDNCLSKETISYKKQLESKKKKRKKEREKQDQNKKTYINRNNLKKYRILRGITMQMLSTYTKLSLYHIREIENQKRIPSSYYRNIICNMFGVSEEQMFYYEEEENNET